MRNGIVLLLGAAVCLHAQEPAPADGGLLRWMDSIAQRELDTRAAAIAKVRTTADAERRNEYTRAKILELIGGLPDYAGPLNPQMTGRLEHSGYAIEKVYFESLPKVFVTANVYVPTSAGPHPGILLPLGHWEQGKPGPQRLAANLALKGFVVLAYDPYGQGERLQAYDARLGRALAGGSTDQHFMAGAQRLLIGQSFARDRIWDAKRALDYLVSRPDVVKDRIGCTGCSGGGTLTTYISALDPRIKVAAPACYMNSFRVLFTGSIGDSEQSLPDFLSSGLDQTDFVELFAPKPWLISSTIDDFFKIEGARQVYEEAKHWYRVYGAEDRIRWNVGHGGHGTPLEIREGIYAWFLRWLADGKGSPDEQQVELHPDYELQVTKTGQVTTSLGSREIDALIRDDFNARKRRGSQAEMMEVLRGFSPDPGSTDTISLRGQEHGPEFDTARVAIEAEPGLQLQAAILAPRTGGGRKPAVLVVETQAVPSPIAEEFARAGAVVLSLLPRGEPAPESTRLLGDWLANTRAWLIGRNLPGLRASDIRRGVTVLSARSDVDPARIRVAARDVAGVWALMAAALDSRITGLWLDRTPYSLRAALDNPLHRNLHDAVLPGFILRWDLDDLVKAIAPRPVLWTDPQNWMGAVVPLGGNYRYRISEESTDAPYIDALLR